MFSDYRAITKEYMAIAYEDPKASAEDLTAEYAAAVDECIEYYLLKNG